MISHEKQAEKQKSLTVENIQAHHPRLSAKFKKPSASGFLLCRQYIRYLKYRHINAWHKGTIAMDNSYLLLKSLHIFGAVIFLGNIIVTGWWKVLADRTRNPVIIAFAQRQVTLTDYVFTAAGVVLVLATGIGHATLHRLDYLSIPWLAWGFWFFVISCVIWAAVLIPVQIKQAKMARQFQNGGTIPENYWTLGRIRIVFATLATVIPLAVIYWMVFKPA